MKQRIIIEYNAEQGQMGMIVEGLQPPQVIELLKGAVISVMERVQEKQEEVPKIILP